MATGADLKSLLSGGKTGADLKKLLATPGEVVSQEREPDSQPESPTERAYGLLDAFTQGVTFGFGDELTAVESALLGKTPEGGMFDYSLPISERYQRALDAERAQQKAFSERHPVASTSAEIAGAVVNPVNRLLPVSGVARGAAGGALYGGLYGAGSGEDAEGRLTGAAYGAILGGGTGAATGAVGRMLGRTRANVPATSTQLKQQAGAAYRRAEDAGVIISRDSWRTFSDGVRNEMAKEGIDQALEPRALAALNRLTEVDDHVTLEGAEILRRVLSRAADSPNRAERRLAMIMMEKLDDYIGNLQPGDILAGPAQTAVASLKEARSLWSRASKSEIVERAVERARNRAGQYSISGLENSLRTEFRQIAQNERTMRRFSPAEREAVRRVAQGTSLNNMLRLLGKFAPTGPISLGGAAYIGGILAGPLGAALAVGTGGAARIGARAMTGRAARVAGEVMRAGGPLYGNRPLLPAEETLIRGLLAGSVSQERRVSSGGFSTSQ